MVTSSLMSLSSHMNRQPSSIAYLLGRSLRIFVDSFNEGVAGVLQGFAAMFLPLIYIVLFSLPAAIGAAIFRLLQNDFYSQPSQNGFLVCNIVAFALPFLSSLTAFGHRTLYLNSKNPSRKTSMDIILTDYSLAKSVSLNLLTLQYSLLQGFFAGVIIVALFDLPFIYYSAGASGLWIPFHWTIWLPIGLFAVMLLLQCRIFFELRAAKVRYWFSASNYFDSIVSS